MIEIPFKAQKLFQIEGFITHYRDYTLQRLAIPVTAFTLSLCSAENGLKADVIRAKVIINGTFLELFVSGFKLLNFRFFKIKELDKDNSLNFVYINMKG